MGRRTQRGYARHQVTHQRTMRHLAAVKEDQHMGRKNQKPSRGTSKWYPQLPVDAPPIPTGCECEPGYRCGPHWSVLTDAERRAVLRERAGRNRGGAA